MCYLACLRVDCEGSHSEKQVCVSKYLLCIARPGIQVSKTAQKCTFSGKHCEGSHSSREASIKTIVVRAIEKKELGISLKPGL